MIGQRIQEIFLGAVICVLLSGADETIVGGAGGAEDAEKRKTSG